MGSTMGRRSAITAAAVLAGGAAAQGLEMVLARPARAAVAYGQTPKSAVGYRDSPDGSRECGNCMHFIPGPAVTANGHCAVVAGSISPHGWCQVWTAKS